jgi:hypothetical protein
MDPGWREDDVGNWMRRIRGAIGMGLSWALAWFSAGMILFFIVGPDAADVPFPLGFGALGFFGGVAFSGVLGIAERRRSFDEMSMPRFAIWGGIGGAVLAVLFVLTVTVTGAASLLDDLVYLAPIFAAGGAGCAAGSLALARMAGEPDSVTSGRGPADLAGLGSRGTLPPGGDAP